MKKTKAKISKAKTSKTKIKKTKVKKVATKKIVAKKTKPTINTKPNAQKKKIVKVKKTIKAKVSNTKKANKSKTTKIVVVKASMNKKDYSKFKNILLEKRTDLTSIVKSSKEHDLVDAEIGDEIDSATQNAEKEMLFELADNERVMLDEIELALRRIEKGTYGNCELCQCKIAPERLEVLPWVRCCITCQQKAEKPSR